MPQAPRRPVPAGPGSLANVLEHLPDVPRTQWCTGGRGKYPAGVLPMRSGSLCSAAWSTCHSLSAPAAICASFSAAGPRGLGVSSGPVRAQHRDRGRIAVQVDVRRPPDRPGFLGARQPSGSPRCRRAAAGAGCRGSFSPACRFSASGARRPHGAPSWSRGGGHCSWAPFSRPGACTGGSRVWLPGFRLAFQKGNLAGRTWWAQVGSNHRLLACKASALPLSYAPLVRAGRAPGSESAYRSGRCGRTRRGARGSGWGLRLNRRDPEGRTRCLRTSGDWGASRGPGL